MEMSCSMSEVGLDAVSVVLRCVRCEIYGIMICLFCHVHIHYLLHPLR